MSWNIFCPNGIHSLKILSKLAKKEFGDSIKDVNSYVELKREITKSLSKLSARELEENKLDTLVAIKHLEQNDFGNFISLRFTYWAFIITIAVMIIGDVPIYTYFNMSKGTFAEIMCILLTLLLITIARTINYQHDELEYLHFKLICFEEIVVKHRK